MSPLVRPAVLLAVLSTMSAAAFVACTEEPSSAGAGGAGGNGILALMFGTADDPTTCEDAAFVRSYLGCDFWPTVTFNPVWSEFDFAVVVANIGAEPAEVTVSGSAGFAFTTTVEPRDVATIALPWVGSLKGPEFDVCTSSTAPAASVLLHGAA